MRGIGLSILSAGIVLAIGCPAPRADSAPPTLFSLASRLPALSPANGGSLGDIQWIEQVYTANTNEAVDVAVSPSYPADQPIGQRWAEFFAALPHGSELARLRAYI